MYGQWLGDPQVAQKITSAVNEGADVLNSSWSFQDYSTTLGMAFAYVYKMNRVSVATMGNTGITETRYPGAFTNVIAVGATQNTDVISPFFHKGSSYRCSGSRGVNPDPLDPRNIFSTQIGNNYGFEAGTSFAAPQVTGTASLLKGFNNNLSNDDIRQIIRLTADDNIVPGPDPEYGFGRINAGEALEILQAPNQLFQWSASGGTDFSSTGNISYQFYGAGSLSSGNYIAKRHEVRKTITFPQTFCHIFGAWGRGVSTTGWNMGNPNYGEGFCEIIPGTLTGTGATLRTYVYEVYTVLGQWVGWYPTTPANVAFAYTVLGRTGTPFPTAINGDNLLCTSNKTYTLNTNWPATWTHSGNVILQSGQGTISAVFRATSSAAGPGWIEAAITDCAAEPLLIHRDIQAGPYNTSQINVTGQSGVCPGNAYNYYANVSGFGGPSTYTWTYPSNWSVFSQSGNYIRLYVPQYNPDYGTVMVSVNDGCGPSGYTGLTVYPYYNCGGYNIVYYPNPAEGQLTVEAVDQSDGKLLDNGTTVDFEMFILNDKNKIVKYGTSKNNRMVLDISDLKPGSYILIIINDQNAIQDHLVIK